MSALLSDVDLASLDAEALRVVVVSLLDENRGLETRITEFEAAGKVAGKTKSPNCGHSDAEPIERAMDLVDGPIFPNEIFLMIAGYLDPGTQTLSKLARTCRGLYELILPRLFDNFTVDRVLTKPEDAARFYTEDSPLPDGLACVRHLDTRIGAWEIRRAPMNVFARLALRCTNLVKLSCDWETFRFLKPSIQCQTTLEILELRVHEFDADPYAPHIPEPFEPGNVHELLDIELPNLRTLKIGGAANAEIISYLTGICPGLEYVDADFWLARNRDQEWDVTRLLILLCLRSGRGGTLMTV